MTLVGGRKSNYYYCYAFARHKLREKALDMENVCMRVCVRAVRETEGRHRIRKEHNKVAMERMEEGAETTMKPPTTKPFSYLINKLHFQLHRKLFLRLVWGKTGIA